MKTKYSEIINKIELINPLDYSKNRNFIDGSVTKLSPKRIVGMMMGMWFFASAAGNFVAGLIARATASDEMSGGENIFTLAQKSAFIDVYTNVGLIAVFVGLLLAVCSPFMKKGMHGIN